MKALITPALLAGTIEAISSKSDAHRHLICAALSNRETELLRLDDSQDISATATCLRALGATIEQSERRALVQPLKTPVTGATLDCAESGSTLRFMLPVAAACADGVRFTGTGRLPERPLGELIEVLRHNGVAFSSDQLPLETRGRLRSGRFELPGNVSSQYITGLLLALPLLEGSSEIVLTTPLESTAYVDITLAVLEHYGIVVHKRKEGFVVPGNQRYRSPAAVTVEGDWSNAAFFLAAGALGAPVTVTGLTLNSPQGDRKVIDFLRRFGAEVSEEPAAVSVS
ncbi:MAG: 3-phosphoshikimate 1-carboxyvinyltransferase, partial [Coriobacteriales bacterium]|nr:3-phosphoshikimate 1-carboxyvinyltransferase [Coriobacteriales bacterium]